MFMSLPRGSTALDFAFILSAPISVTVQRALEINGVNQLGTILKTGNRVQNSYRPQCDSKAEWLGFVATNKARRALFEWLKA